MKSNRQLEFCCFLVLSFMLSFTDSIGQNTFSTVRIKNEGKVSGDVKISGHQGKIEILKYNLEFKDLGLKTAKGTINIVKPYDSSTTAWLSAYAGNKEIQSFEIEIFLKIQQVPDFKLIFEMGKIMNISHKYNEINKLFEEEISISFGKYTMSYQSGKQEVEGQIQKIN